MDVIWQAFQSEDPFAPIQKAPWTYLGRDWMDCAANAQSAVNEVCEDYFDDGVWDEWFGLDSTCAEVLVEVTVPASIGGVCRVDLERVTKAQAARVDDPRSGK